ncbi:MAG: rhodanese-like domain-containing protein [Bacteroidales bacterium]|nr:rhodanese-like domain-containing protein [Bacteroidales bacterium]
MKIRAYYSLILLFFVGACAEKADEGSVIRNVGAAEFKVLVDKGEGQLVDLRTPDEFASGYIEGASLINIYSPDFRDQLSMLDRETPVYIYCRSGNRSANSIYIFEEMGFREIVNLRDGILEWTEMGFGLVQ